MNKKLQALVLVIIVGCFMSSKSFADQDYQQRNFFNRFTDWSVTIGKNSEERQRIIDQRTSMRAREREAADQRRSHDDKMRNQKDEEDKNHDDHRSDSRNQ